MFYGVMYRYLKAEELSTAHVVVDGSTKDVERVIHHDTRVEQSTWRYVRVIGSLRSLHHGPGPELQIK